MFGIFSIMFTLPNKIALELLVTLYDRFLVKKSFDEK